MGAHALTLPGTFSADVNHFCKYIAASIIISHYFENQIVPYFNIIQGSNSWTLALYETQSYDK